MTKCIILAVFIWTAGCSIAPYPPLQNDPYQESLRSDWEGARVFVFDSLILDLNRNLERFVPDRRYAVDDCSTTSLYCLNRTRFGSTLSVFSVPKACREPRIGEVWGAEVPTKVLAAIGASSDNGDYRSWIISAEGRPNIVFMYRPISGISEYIIAVDSRSNLAGHFERGGSIENVPFKFLRLRIKSFDRLANCVSASDVR